MPFTVEGLRNIRLLPRDPSEPPDPELPCCLRCAGHGLAPAGCGERETGPVALVGDGAASRHALPFPIVNGKDLVRRQGHV